MYTIIIAQPKYDINQQCPNCNQKIKKALQVRIKCGFCQKPFNTNKNHQRKQHYINQIMQAIQKKNEVTLQTDTSNQTYLQTHQEIVSTIKNQYKFLQIKETKETTDTTNKRICRECGTCMEEFECNHCKKRFEPKKVKTKTGTHTNYHCTYCQSPNIKRLHIKTNKKECPHCRTKNIKQTQFLTYENKKPKCPRCKGTKIKTTQKINVLQTHITLHKRYWHDE